jgi:hypothetical protein
VQHIDHAFELRLRADRDLQRHDAVAVGVAQGLQQAVVVRAVALHLVHKDQAGQLTRFTQLPSVLKSDLQLRLRGRNQDDRIDDLNCAVKLADEVGEARGVNKVDFVPLPLDRKQGCVEADFAPLLFGVEVRGRIACFNAANAVNMSSDIQEMLCESRFPTPAMSCQRYIAYLLQRVLFHGHDS